MAKTEVDAEAVMAALAEGKFDIEDNPYGCEVSIKNYVDSIYTALDKIEESWKNAVSKVGNYITNFQEVEMPQEEVPSADFLKQSEYAEPQNGTLRGVTSNLRIRSGASTSSTILGNIGLNTSFSVLGKYTNNNGEVWYEVQTADGTKGYASGDFIVDPGNATTIPSYQEQATNQQSSVTTLENNKSASESINNGTLGTVSNHSSTSSTTSQSTSKEKTGIVSIKYGNSKLNARKTPEKKDDNIITTLSRGEKVTILEDDGKSEWILIKTEKGEQAYVAREYISIPSNKTTIAKVNIKETNSSLNVRSSPSNKDNKNIINYLRNNEAVEVIGKSDVPGWTKIRINGEEAYVSSQYLDM